MSVPTEVAFAQIKIGDGADPEVFTVICDISSVSINATANTTDQFRRDCAKPNLPATRKVKVTGKQWDITGSGLADAGQIPLLLDAVGTSANFEVPGYQDDGTDGGGLLGTWSGNGVLTADNLSLDREGDSSGEITIAGNGDLTFTPAP